MALNGGSAVPLTVVILALNESQVLARCIARLRWADEILVVDSGSTDETVQLAQSLGAQVVSQPWLGWSVQRNVGSSLAHNDWVLFVEADEVVTVDLEQAIRRVFASPPSPADAFAIDRRDEFMGGLMPQAQRRRTVRTFVRLFNRRESRWDERMLVHERVVVPGRVVVLDGILAHWRRQSLSEQAERIVRYSNIEAQALDERGQRPSAVKLVLHPVARFIWLFLVRGGFRAGRRGFIHAVLRSFADLLRHARHFEMHLGETPPDPPGYERPDTTSGPRGARPVR